MDWYKTLDLHQKINLKDNTQLICGLSWTQLGILFSFTERIDILHNKLKMEGFEV